MIRIILTSIFTINFLAACDCSYASYPKAKSLAENPKMATEFLSNVTFRSYSGSHGKQYEYLASNGTTALIYPSNTGPVRGRWAIRGAGEFEAKMCFAYRKISYNPVTRRSGGSWECSYLIGFLYELDEIFDGVLFGIRSRNRFERPFLRRLDISITAALKSRGRKPPSRPNKALSKERR